MNGTTKLYVKKYEWESFRSQIHVKVLMAKSAGTRGTEGTGVPWTFLDTGLELEPSFVSTMHRHSPIPPKNEYHLHN